MKNLLKAKLQEKKSVIGTFVQMPHPDAAEFMTGLGFDWLLLDSEHGPMGYETLQMMMQAMNGSGCTPIVRPEWNDMVTIKRILDIGAHGILVPMVNTREEAEYAAKACLYPPAGVRGVGPRRAAMFDRDYFATADEEIMTIVQVETPLAISNLDEILKVEGIDACYVGPTDLAYSMGMKFPDFKNQEFLDALDRVVESANKAGKPAGLYSGKNNIEIAVQKGFTLNTLDNTDTFLLRGAISALKVFRNIGQND